jgi:hypothetical protein
MATQKTLVGATLALAVILMVAGVLAIIQSSKTVPSHGHIQGISVNLYSDAGCTLPLTSVDWGNINNGTSTIYTIYIKNEGTANMTLSMTTNTWTPSNATSYVTLTWNRDSYVLANQTSVSADLDLTVSPSLTDGMDFTVNIVVIGTSS